jgi:ornithine carbamoyltransferase
MRTFVPSFDCDGTTRKELIMAISLSGRNFLKLLDFSPNEIRYLIKLSKEFKNLKLTGTPHRYLEGKNIVLLFEKTSTRTRCAFEVAGMDLGMGVTYLDPGSSQMGKKESIEDTARVLGRMYDGIEYRGFAQSIVEELGANAGVPVWNGLTTEFHPTQMIADMLTVEENFPQGIKGLKLVFMGDAQNNVANSLMVVCAKLGLHFVACGPKEQMPADELVKTCRSIAAENGGSVTLSEDAQAACAGAHVVYTDIWVSMGEPAELWAKRVKLLEPYRVTSKLMALADAEAIFMHCLPSFHDVKTTIGAEIAEKFGVTEMEVSDEVFESSRSRVFDEAENRMHTIKAVMYATLS